MLLIKVQDAGKITNSYLLKMIATGAQGHSGKAHSINPYLSHKGFCVLQDRDEGNLQKRGEKLHLDQLLPGAGKGEHG